MKAFLASPRAESKSYAIVDVGAGTTEVSFFFNGTDMNEPGQPPRASYLADSTKPVGGCKIDLELAQAWSCGVEDARGRKETGQTPIPAVPSVGEICVQYERTCAEILKQRRLTASNDMRFDLFIIGGGGRFQPLQRAIRRSQLPGGFVCDEWRQIKPPKNLRDGAALDAGYDFLAIACGLASSLDWDYYPPREVEPMTIALGPR